LLVDAFLKSGLAGAARLRIWGGCPSEKYESYVSRIESKARGSDAIALEGSFPADRLPDVLDQIDVLVIPSVLYENNPLVILEAFAAGIPVIAGDVGGMAELVHHDKDGLLFHLGDMDDLAEKLALMVEAEKLQYYRSNIASPLTFSEMGSEVERLCASLVQDHG
jgi:glycosyltransferase involved in cell wall biosynthesis